MRVLVLLCVVALSSCVFAPGGSGWGCDRDADCNSGMTCREHSFWQKRGPDKVAKVCSEPGKDPDGTGFSWFTIIISYVLVIAGIAIAVAVARKKLQERAERAARS